MSRQKIWLNRKDIDKVTTTQAVFVSFVPSVIRCACVYFCLLFIVICIIKNIKITSGQKSLNFFLFHAAQIYDKAMEK